MSYWKVKMFGYDRAKESVLGSLWTVLYNYFIYYKSYTVPTYFAGNTNIK